MGGKRAKVGRELGAGLGGQRDSGMRYGERRQTGAQERSSMAVTTILPDARSRAADKRKVRWPLWSAYNLYAAQPFPSGLL